MEKNNNRDKIVALIGKAESKIQIAVSWLTDEYIINKISEVSNKVTVEIVLSNDILNAYRKSSITTLQKKGAKIIKFGSAYSGTPEFMHYKMIIIDGKYIYAGSFNFTTNASKNYEHFEEYPSATLAEYTSNFSSMLQSGRDYQIGFENEQQIKEQLLDNIRKDEEFRKTFTNHIASERVLAIQAEIKADEKKQQLQTTASSLQTGTGLVASNGSVENNDGVKSKPHKFYGGSFLKTNSGKKKSNSYAVALCQKNGIMKKFDFLNCQIIHDTLVCQGIIQIPGCDEYKIRIEYLAGESPFVYIINKKIQPDSNIHVYKEGALCLFYPGEFKWKDTTSIAEYTIPWIFEWILFYEIYLITGIWEAPAKEHSIITPFRRAA